MPRMRIGRVIPLGHNARAPARPVLIHRFGCRCAAGMADPNNPPIVTAIDVCEGRPAHGTNGPVPRSTTEQALRRVFPSGASA